jgi:PAS domain S-box-containing protein
VLPFIVPVSGMALRLALGPWNAAGLPYITLWPMVLIVAALAGIGPGLLAAALGFGAVWFWFIPPIDTLFVTGDKAVALIIYIIVNAIGIYLVDRGNLYQSQMADARDRNHALEAEREVAQVAAHESRERLNALLDQAPLGIVEFDLAGRVRQASEPAASLLGRKVHEVVGRPWYDFIHADDRSLVESQIEAVVDTGRQARFTSRIVRPDGLVVLTRSRVCLIRDSSRKPQSLLSMFGDYLD